VKTRIAAALGTPFTARFYTLCIDLLQKELPLLADTYDLAVCPSRAEDCSWAKEVFPFTSHIVPQQGDGLGERLETSFTSLRELGYRDVLFIGSDAPSLPLPYLRVLRRLLYEKDVVLGPAQDGGVYALGSRVELPGLQEITWSTEHVFSELLDRLAKQGLAVGIGPPWYDVDTADDLQRAAEDLGHSPSLARQQFGQWVAETLVSSGTEHRIHRGEP